MTSRRAGRLVPTILAAALLAAGCSSGGTGGTGGAGEGGAVVQPGATLRGVVGEPDDPDAFTITLTDASGTPVRALPAGDYTIEVQDLSQIHNWHLAGPGVDEATSVREVGQQSFTVTLQPGEYSYSCDPHPNMSGTIVVT